MGPCEGLEPKARPSLPPLNDRYKMAFWGAEFPLGINIVGEAGASAPRPPVKDPGGETKNGCPTAAPDLSCRWVARAHSAAGNCAGSGTSAAAALAAASFSR